MSKRHQNSQIQTFCYAVTCQCRQLSRPTNKFHSYSVTRSPADAGSYRVRAPRGTKMHKSKHFVTRPPASADSYRVRPTNFITTLPRGHADTGSYRFGCQRGIKIHKYKYFVTRPPASADSFRVRPTNFIPTPSRGDLRTQAAIALDVQGAPRSTNPNILLRGQLPVQTAIAFDQQLSFLQRHAATCGRRHQSR